MLLQKHRHVRGSESACFVANGAKLCHATARIANVCVVDGQVRQWDSKRVDATTSDAPEWEATTGKRDMVALRYVGLTQHCTYLTGSSQCAVESTCLGGHTA